MHALADDTGTRRKGGHRPGSRQRPRGRSHRPRRELLRHLARVPAGQERGSILHSPQPPSQERMAARHQAFELLRLELRQLCQDVPPLPRSVQDGPHRLLPAALRQRRSRLRQALRQHRHHGLPAQGTRGRPHTEPRTLVPRPPGRLRRTHGPARQIPLGLRADPDELHRLDPRRRPQHQRGIPLHGTLETGHPLGDNGTPARRSARKSPRQGGAGTEGPRAGQDPRILGFPLLRQLPQGDDRAQRNDLQGAPGRQPA